MKNEIDSRLAVRDVGFGVPGVLILFPVSAGLRPVHLPYLAACVHFGSARGPYVRVVPANGVGAVNFFFGGGQ